MPHRRPRAPSPHGLTVEVSYDSWIAVIAVFGDVDSSSVARLRTAVDEVTGTGHDLLIDMTQCPFVDSSGLSQVLRAQQLACAQDSAFGVVCQDGGIPARVLEIVCAGAIPMHRTRDDALQKMHHAADVQEPPLGRTRIGSGAAAPRAMLGPF
jgi:anti-anti-sigma factor